MNSEKSTTPKTLLRAVTYLVPSIPVEFFEAVLQYLEVRLDVEYALRYESRWEWPQTSRRNPFNENEVDIAFMTRSAFLRMAENKDNVELLPVASVHKHPRAEDRPGHFLDIVVNRNLKETVKEFSDLRGCRWAHNVNDLIGGSLMPLHNLKIVGECASFFGNILKSRSHLESIKMILSRQAHATAVDSNALKLYLKSNQDHKDELAVLTSWGPLPPYAIVARKGMSVELKERVVDTLLNMNYDQEGARILSQFDVRRFASTTTDDFKIERDLKESTRTMKFEAVYY